MIRNRHVRLSQGSARAVRFLSGLHVSLQDGKRTSTVTITRTGTFTDPRYGQFEITREMLLAIVENFKKRVFGQDIFIDVAHRPDQGAAGKVLSLAVEGNRLRAEVEWTDYGIEAVRKRGYQYLSAELHENYVDNEQGQAHGPVLLGAGLTIRPVIKRLDPVQLSESSVGDGPTYLHPELKTTLLHEAQQTMNQHLKKLREQLEARKLSAAAIDSLMGLAEAQIKALAADDEAGMLKVVAQFEEAGQRLAEAIGAAPATVTLAMPASGLTAEDVRKLLAEERQAQAAAQQARDEALAANRAAFAKVLAEAQGLDEDMKRELTESAMELVTAEMSTEQARKLGEHQLAMGQRMAAVRTLSGMGYTLPAGTTRIHTEAQGHLRLQEMIDTGLRGAMTTIRSAGADTKVSPFVARTLAMFDAMNGHRYDAEVKRLSGAETNIADGAFPVGFQRTVIREALHDLNILQLVQTLTDASATATTNIPYEERDTSAVVNDGIVFEGQGIPGASIAQKMDLAYILPMKLAMTVTNEMMHFSRASAINWDAWGRNVESNARVMRELVARRLANELMRAADAYAAVAVTGENIAAQLAGASSRIKTAQFPIVRPHQQYDMQGNAVGAAQNPITLVINGATIQPWDGTGTQAAGTYYRIASINLGYIDLVDAAGNPVTPTATTATLGYSYATNVAKFDIDVPTGKTLEQHLNGLLQKIGARKAILMADRYVTPDFLLMSPVLNDIISNAEQFAAEAARNGSNTNAQGDLATVKGISAFGTNAPGIDLGDERIVMGSRGTTSYTISKPFMTGTPFEAVDSLGRPTGKKVAYGEEYSAIHTPLPIRNRLTSVLVYSATGR